LLIELGCYQPSKKARVVPPLLHERGAWVVPMVLPRLGMNRMTLLSRMKKFGIYVKQYA
jgi:hypothetical protein